MGVVYKRLQIGKRKPNKPGRSNKKQPTYMPYDADIRERKRRARSTSL